MIGDTFWRFQEENMELKMRKTDLGETLQWTDYMSLSFTQHVRNTIKIGTLIYVISWFLSYQQLDLHNILGVHV